MASFTLKTKMTLMVSLLVTGLMAILTIAILLFFARQFKESISRQQFTLVSAMAEEIDNKIRITQSELILVGGTVTPGIIASPDLAKKFIANHPDTELMFDHNLYLFDDAGNALASSEEHPLLQKELHFRQCLNDTVSGAVPKISEPFASDELQGHPVIVFTAPVFGPHGEVTAVLAGVIDLLKDNFLGKLAGTRIGDKGYVYLFNTSRTLIVHPDRSRIFKNDVPVGVNRLFDKAVGGFEGTGETLTSRGLKALSSFKRLKTTNWILAANFPRAEAYAPINKAIGYLVVLLPLAGFMTIVLVWIFMNILTSPLLSFTSQVREITGHMATKSRIRIDTGDEIGMLAQAFNLMLAELDVQKEALQHQLNFFQVLIDTIPTPVFYKDVEAKYLGCNKAFEACIGFSREQLIGATYFDIAPPELAERYREDDRELLRNKEIQVYEASLAYADGTLHDVIFFKSAFQSSGSAVGGLVGTILDISDRKRAESALAAEKEFAENLVMNSTAPTFVLDPDHRVIIWNRACEELTGIPAAEMLGGADPWKPFYPHKRPVLADLLIDGRLEEIPGFYESYEISAMNPEGFQGERWFPGLNGRDRYVFYNAAPIRNSCGELIAVIETLEDITGRKTSEEQIKHALSLLNATLESTADGILVVDRSGKIVTSNSKFAEMWRIPEETLATKEENRVIAVILEQLTEPESFFDQVTDLYRRPDAESEDTIAFKDGRIFERSSKPQRVAAEIVGRVWCYRDVTDRNRLQEDLRQSQKMEALGTLTGGIAHDFNNILTTIIGFGSLMQRRQSPDDPSSEHLKKILAAADSATALTKGLLAYSRKESLHQETVDLNDIVRKGNELLTRLIGEDIDLTTMLADEKLPILVDSGQIQQVLMNLATNARHAITGAGSLVISTRLAELDDRFLLSHGYGKKGRYALLTISDSGIGMDRHTMDRIFEPFFTTKGPGTGTGLGLSIVYGIVKQHHGYINVYSEPEHGTTFKVYLPLTDHDLSAIDHALLPIPTGGTETLLLVEDNADIRQLLQELLTDAGYRIIEAFDGQDGIEKFREHREEIRLLILDVIMPRKNGKEVYEEARIIQKDLKALFMSGYTADIISRKGILEGEYNFISKPLSPSEILRKIRSLLDE